MQAGGMSRGLPVYVRRYAPIAAIIVVQLLLLTLMPTTKSQVTTTQAVAGGDQTGEVTQQPTGSDGAASGVDAAGGRASSVTTIAGAAGATSSAGAGSTKTATGVTSPGANPSATKAAGGTTAGASNAAVDELGRPTTGDKSKCAQGGLLQETVTSQSPPCIPKFVGDNGGATSPGVTADTITVLVVHPRYQQGLAQALQAGGLDASDSQWDEIVPLEVSFLNKHYELYGRQIKGINVYTTCTDAPCLRADAKAFVAKYHPFAITWYTQGIAPESFMDQMAQLGVVNLGIVPLSDAWFKAHAPFSWDLFPQGDRQADMLANYYCNKMYGQNATHAGDPTMQVKKRKLGIISTDTPASLDVARRFEKLVTGGQCGSGADGTTVYVQSSDTTTAQNQAPTLVTRMKNDGITTRVSVGGVPGYPEDDRQGYFPENVMSFASDADIVGRLFQGLISPNQMAHVFGLGWLQRSQPIEKQDFYKAIKDVNPSYEPVRIAQGSFYGLSLLALLFQWAGPRLTPQNVEKGAHTSVQIGGWQNPTPWNGWKCCNPYVNEYKLGINANSYTAKVDAKEEYWDAKATSEDDNQAGAFVCVDPNCRRYEVGQWPKGEALKP